MAGLVKQTLAKPIELAHEVVRAANKASSFTSECAQLKSKAEKLASLLRQVARSANDLYELPTSGIIDGTNQVLKKALTLVRKCLANRLFTVISPAAAFRKIAAQLDNSIDDVSWLVLISAASDGDENLGVTPTAAHQPIHCLVWEQIAILSAGSSCPSLVSLARDSDQYRKLIIEEGGVEPLVRLLRIGKLECQESAAETIGHLGKDPESVELLIDAGVHRVFANFLREGPMKLQGLVAWAVSELVSHYPRCQDLFAEYNVIRFLISHLAVETIPEHSKYAITTKSIQENNHSLYGKGREYEDPATKAYMKAMAARALSRLAKDNSAICRSITESRALLCFALLLEKGPEDVKYNSALALMEITAVAERDTDLRRAAFKPKSPVYEAIVEQLLIHIEKEDSQLLIPCVAAIGNLARTFTVSETRMITPLVNLLHEREAEVSTEVTIALIKFACIDNYLHLDHSKAIINAGGARHLIQLAYFGEQIVQSPAIVLLCYIAMHVPHSSELAEAEVFVVLEWASKQGHLVQDEAVEALLDEAKDRLKLL